MKKTRVLLSLVALMALSEAALAAPAWTDWGKITSLESYGDNIYVKGIALALNPGECTHTNMVRLKSSLPAASKEAIIFVLTSALLANREVRLRIDDACQDTYPALIGVQIQ